MSPITDVARETLRSRQTVYATARELGFELRTRTDAQHVMLIDALENKPRRRRYGRSPTHTKCTDPQYAAVLLREIEQRTRVLRGLLGIKEDQ